MKNGFSELSVILHFIGVVFDRISLWFFARVPLPGGMRRIPTLLEELGNRGSLFARKVLIAGSHYD